MLGLGEGRVLVSGGYVIADAAAPGLHLSRRTHVYNPVANTWASTNAVGARGVGVLVLGNGLVVVAGGQDLTWADTQQSAFRTTVRRSDPATGSGRHSIRSNGGAGFTLVEAPERLPPRGGGPRRGQLAGRRRQQDRRRLGSGKHRVVLGTEPCTSRAPPRERRARRRQRPRRRRRHVVDRVLRVGDARRAPRAPRPPSGRADDGHAERTGPPHRSASDVGGSGVGTYDIGRSVDGGAFSTIATRRHGEGLRHDRVRQPRLPVPGPPSDYAGNVGGWAAASGVRISVKQQTSSSISFERLVDRQQRLVPEDTVKYSKTAGASATATFTGKGIAFVSTRGPARGSAKIYIDGTLATTVSLNRSTVSYRYVAFQRSWSTSGKHTIKIVVSGTSGHPRVDVDAFEVLEPLIAGAQSEPVTTSRAAARAARPTRRNPERAEPRSIGTSGTRNVLPREVRLLGALLGEIIVEQAGDEVFELVEATASRRSRPAARARRAGHVRRPAGGRRDARGRRPGVRAVLPAHQPGRGARPRPTSDAAGSRDRRRVGGGAAASRAAAAGRSRGARGVRIHPVLTAHPTEARRRTVLVALRRVARLLERRTTRGSSPPTIATSAASSARRSRSCGGPRSSAAARRPRSTRSGRRWSSSTRRLYRLVPRLYRLVGHAPARCSQPAGPGARSRRPPGVPAVRLVDRS